MKIKRHKKVKRYLSFYKNNFNFRNPYQVLIDATFCKEALSSKINIKEQLPKYLEDPGVRYFTTPCVIIETESLGQKVFGAMLVVKQFKALKCGHAKNPIGAAECLYSMVENGNPNHYLIATQDRHLSEKCRQLTGVPILYINYNAVNLEKPSNMNTETVQQKMKETLEVSDYHTSMLKKLKTDVFGEQHLPKKKKKKIKGPNPLSCKKKKSKVIAPQVEKVKKRKRHKRHKNAITE